VSQWRSPMAENRTPEPQPAAPVSAPELRLPQGAEPPAEPSPEAPPTSSRPGRLAWGDRLEQLGRLQLYPTWQPRARSGRIALHMLIGLILAVLLLAQAVLALLNWAGLRGLT